MSPAISVIDVGAHRHRLAPSSPQIQQEAPTIIHERHLNEQGSYTTDLCVSVIAIAGTPDLRYLQENNIEIEEVEDGEEFVCELHNGKTIPIKGTDNQLNQMRSLLNKGTLVSAETTIATSSDTISVYGDDGVYLPPGKLILKPSPKRLRRATSTSAKPKLKGTKNVSHDERNLASYEGNKQVLVVRVTDSKGVVHADNARVISDKVFGTYGDKVNMKSQFAACSFDSMQMTNEYSVDIDDKLTAPGVLGVTIPVALANSDRATVREASVSAVERKLGFTLPGPFDHVMFVLEGCYTDCGW